MDSTDALQRRRLVRVLHRQRGVGSVLGRLLLLDQDPAWTASSALRSTSAELARSASFRAFANELTPNLLMRSWEDQALAVLIPAVLPLIAEFYADAGPPLADATDLASMIVLDDWLARQIRDWGSRWFVRDPARSGSPESTRVAVAELAREMESRHVPLAVDYVVAGLLLRSGFVPEVEVRWCRSRRTSRRKRISSAWREGR